MDATHKLRARFNADQEFECEGSAEFITERYKVFVSDAAGTSALNRAELTDRILSQTFNLHGNGMVSVADTFFLDRHQILLLILYGFTRLRSRANVPASSLTKSAEYSGQTFDRIDREIAPSIEKSYVEVEGQTKGTKYNLTKSGITTAESIIWTNVQSEFWEKLTLKE